MPRTAAVLPEGVRISDLLSMGLLATKVPREDVMRVLEETGRQSKRIRQLPASVFSVSVCKRPRVPVPTT